MSDRSRKLRLGGFVALGLACLTGLAILFGGTPRLFDNRESYTVLFGEAPGLAPGSPVRKSGVRVGEVTGIQLDDTTGQVRVTIRMDKDYRPRQNEEATIFRGILSGDTSLDFIPKANPDGSPVDTRGEVYPVTAVIVGQTPINPNTLVRQASGVLPSAQESMARILNSVQRVEAAVPKIERAFDEVAALARSSREFVPELRRTNEKVQTLLSFNDLGEGQPGELKEGGIRTTLNDLRDLIRTTKPLIEDIRRVVRDNEKDFGETLKAVRKTAESTNELLSEQNKKDFGNIVRNISVASDELIKSIRLVGVFLDQGDRVLKEFNDRWPQIDRILKSTNGAVTAAEGAFKSAEVAAKNIESVTRPIAENAEPLLKNVSASADQLAKTLTEVRETLRMVNRADGTLQKAITDPSLYNQLNDSAIALTRTLMRAEKIAADLQVFADKIARRPESIGIGGVVRPSAGLKSSPSAPTHEDAILPTPLPPTQPTYGPTVPVFRPTVFPKPNTDLPPK